MIDLSRPSKPSTPPAPQGPRPGTAEYYRMLEAYGFPAFPHPVPPDLEPARHVHLLNTNPGYRNQFEQSRADKAREFKAQIDRDNKEKDLKGAGLGVRGSPSPRTTPSPSPGLSVRSEFKTGHLRDLKEGGAAQGRGSPFSRPGEQDILAKLAMAAPPSAAGAMRDQELLAKLARQAQGQNPMLSSLFGPPGAPVPGLPPGWPPGMGLPPGLMLPPHAAPSSPYMSPMGPHPGVPPTSATSFGSSLAALSRTAQTFVSRTQETEDRARKVASLGAVTPPTRSPTTSNTSNTSSNPGADGVSPLLRHEHTHTHLHLGFNLSSPTHNS